MNAINQVIGYPLGWIMWALYILVKNYGIALLIFTLLTKLAMFPLSLKQQKSSANMMRLQPMINDIQSRYKDNKEKQNEEMMSLYKKEGYNPMSGCLPLLIQMPLLFGMIDVIYKPLYHILRLNKEVIALGESLIAELPNAVSTPAYLSQLAVIREVKNNPQHFMALGQDVVAKIQDLNLSFLWMDLTLTPTTDMLFGIFTNFNPVILIPILSGISSLFVSLQSMRMTSQQANSSAGGMKGMMLMMPVFSTWIAFSVPAGVGLYWFYSNIFSMFQTLVMNKIYNPKEIAEKAKQAMEERKEQERQEKIEAKKKLREAAKEKNVDDPTLEKALSPKEINRRKLAEARKRDAEKYGEEYVEVTDDDLR